MSRHILSGIRVLDLTNVLAGPFATLHLALLGAEVIKIESNQKLDYQRRVPEGINRGSQFNAFNRGVKSCTLNLKQPEAIEILKKLIKVIFFS